MNCVKRCMVLYTLHYMPLCTIHYFSSLSLLLSVLYIDLVILFVQSVCLSAHVCYLDLVPRICPTTRLETPMPIICTDVARPIAVPRVAWGTTSGIEGHILAWTKHNKRKNETKTFYSHRNHKYKKYTHMKTIQEMKALYLCFLQSYLLFTSLSNI